MSEKSNRIVAILASNKNIVVSGNISNIKKYSRNKSDTEQRQLQTSVLKGG